MTNSREDVLAIEAATDLLVRGLRRGDISSLADLVTDATLVLPAGRRTSKGRAVIEYWRNLAMANDGVQMLSTDVDTLAEGLVRDVGTLSMRAKRSEEQILFRYSMLWRKVGDAWTVATMTWNRDAAPGGRRRPGGGQAAGDGGM